MTTGTDRIEAIFQNAREIQASAVACLDQGDIRDAAEKAWGATKCATEALVLARTGEKPEGTPETGAALRLLESMDEAVREAHLAARYYTRWGQLHRECGHSGLCDPREDTERRVRDTAGYIEDAARLAGAEAHGVPATSSSGLILDPKAEPDEVRREALLKVDQRFRRAWDEWHPGQSESAYELVLADIAVRAGWPDQEVVNLLIHWRNKYGHDPKLRELHYRLMLSRAKDPDKLAFAKQTLEDTLRLRPEDEEDVLKDTLDTLLGVDIIRVVKDRGDKPVYCMHTEQGAITLRTIGHVTNWKRCTDRIAEVTGVVVPVVSPEVWGRYAQAILRLCEDVGAGDPVQETRSWLDGYLIERYVRDEKEWEEVARDWDNAAQRQVPFLKRGRIRIFREDFIEWLGKKLDKRLGLHELGRRLRLVEAERKSVNVYVWDCRTRRTRRTSRSVWILPDTFHPP